MSFRRVIGYGLSGKRFFVANDSISGISFIQRCTISQEQKSYDTLNSQKFNNKLGVQSTTSNEISSPSSILRSLKRETEIKAEKMNSDEIPLPPPRRSGKMLLNDKDVLVGKKKDNLRKESTSSSCSSKTENIFIKKLSDMENSSAFKNSTSSFSSKVRERGREEKVLEERKRMLIFRDVGMDLDKPILSRDIFLVLKYFRYGIEFAVDNELERMLRYFNEHALNELKIIQNSKIMRGPMVLNKKKVQTKHEGLPFQVIPSFPVFQAANMLQFCNFSNEIEEKLSKVIKNGSICSSFIRNKSKSIKNSTSITNIIFDQNHVQMTSLSPSTFRRPAVIIYSQLGQKLGAQADLEWRRLAYSTISPSILRYLAKEDTKGEGHITSITEQHNGGLRNRSKDTLSNIKENTMPIDVISLRSMDVYKYRWVHMLYVRRFAQSLLSPSSSSEYNISDAQVNGLLTASSTFVGSKLLQPFYSVLGLRNYLSPHILLVDHEGAIRWLSAGCPDNYERENFPSLLKQLEEEYYVARGQ